jgi:hypothetical protein
MKDQRLIYLQAILTGYLLSELLQDLENGKYQKNDIKYTTNRLAKLLEKKILEDGIGKIWNIDEELVINLLREKETLIKSLSIATPEEFMVINQLIQSYFDNREEFLKRNPILLTKLNT